MRAIATAACSSPLHLRLCAALLTDAHYISLSIIHPSQPRSSEILQPIISTRHTKFYNWSKMFSCLPLITFGPLDIEECRLVFELAHREDRTVRIVEGRWM